MSIAAYKASLSINGLVVQLKYAKFFESDRYTDNAVMLVDTNIFWRQKLWFIFGILLFAPSGE